MKISIDPRKPKREKTGKVDKITYMSPSGRDSDNKTYVKSNTAIPGVKKFKRVQ